MLRPIFILFYLFILCSSEYIPYLTMKKKSKYGEEICRYYDREDQIYYVRACEKGKYCLNPNSQLNQYFSICQDVPTPEIGVSTLNGDCSSKFDCESNLKCVSNKCIYTCTTAGEVPYKNYNTNLYDCGKPALEGYCINREYPIDPTTNSAVPTFTYGSPKHKYQKCGVYTFRHLGSNAYQLKDVKYAHVGSVNNGEYVNDKDLCKSGFALPFYPMNNLEDPSAINTNDMYYRCVTPISIDKIDKRSSNCVIYYKDNDDDTEIKKYNVDQLLGERTTTISSSQTQLIDSLCEYTNRELQISKQKFKEYNNKITDEQREKCGNLEDDKNSCDDNELIKLWYFYKKPQDYILYNETEKLEPVLNYFIQTEYHSYEFTRLLNINYFISLLFLLCL